MNEHQIKIVKRGAREIAAEASDQPEVVDLPLKEARLVKQKMTDTIVGWITEQHEFNRCAEIAARELLTPAYS